MRNEKEFEERREREREKRKEKERRQWGVAVLLRAVQAPHHAPLTGVNKYDNILV